MIALTSIGLAGPEGAGVVAVPQPTDLMVSAVIEQMKKAGDKTIAFIGFSDSWGDLVYNALIKGHRRHRHQDRDQRALRAARHLGERAGAEDHRRPSRRGDERRLGNARRAALPGARQARLQGFTFTATTAASTPISCALPAIQRKAGRSRRACRARRLGLDC